MTTSTVRRFARFLVLQPNGCVTFSGVTVKGYGQFQLGVNKQVRAHRYAYELVHGPIPEGLTLDHTCHTKECPGGETCPHRACVVHVVPEDRGDNVRRSLMLEDYCKAGLHPWVESNIIRRPSRPGKGECRACALDKRRAREGRDHLRV